LQAYIDDLGVAVDFPFPKSFRKDLKTVFGGFPIWSAISTRLRVFLSFLAPKWFGLQSFPCWITP